jgi:Kdo2-lipid IVA lauroyltransferase/acyltransferase
MRHKLEYALLWLVVQTLGRLPRPVSRSLAIFSALCIYFLHRRLRKVGHRNLRMALPDLPPAEDRRILRGVFVSLGRQLAEFCLFPRYTRDNVNRVVIYDGFENFDRARQRGKGVLFLTGHLGGWELSSFVHSLQGNPLQIVMRGLDNPYVDRLVQHYRTLHGNTVVDKDNFVRGLLAAMKQGATVGILMDTNMTPPQGLFVDFFGIPACTASGLARIALRTDAAVVPGFCIWDPVLRKYRLRFDPPVELVRTGNDEADILANTAKFTQKIEEFVRKYPDQWLWVHRRWKTRPESQPSLY